MAAADEGLVEFTGFKGLRNSVDAGAFESSDLEAAENVDIDDAGDVKLRRGVTAASIVYASHSVWSDGDICLAVVNGALTRILPGLETKTLLADLIARPVTYETDGAGRVFWTNGLQRGIVQNGANRSWGLEVPPRPSATARPGALPAGTYQFVMTYVRSDGQESGASRAGRLTLDEPGGLSLVLPVSSDPDVVEKIVYVTKPDGEELREIGYFAASATSATFISPTWPGGPLRTQFMGPPPAGDYIAVSNGHMYVAVGERLYHSEPYNYELFDLRKYLPFNGAITMLAPVEDGLYVGTVGKTLYLQGKSPDELEHQVACEYGVIPGTLAYESADFFGGDAKGRAAVWASTQGLCAGAKGGSVVNLTQDRFAYPATPLGAGITRRWRGMHQYLVTLKGSEVPANVAA